MKTLAVALAVLLGIGSSHELAMAAPAKKPAAARKPVAGKAPLARTAGVKASAKAGATRTVVRRTGKSPGASRRTAAARKTPPRPTVQAQPTADRYREIQQALFERGYLRSEPTGQWNAESVEALRQFQRDQNLEPSGKLDSLSLIALGLGPKRTATAAINTRPQTP